MVVASKGRRRRLAAAALPALLLAALAVLPAAAATPPLCVAPPSTRPALLAAVDPATEVPVYLGLATDAAGLEAFVGEIYRPASPRFRAYRSVEELATEFGAPTLSRWAVEDFFAERGLSVHFDVTGGYARVRMPAARAEELFGLDLRQALDDGGDLHRDSLRAPHVPLPLRGHVVSVFGYELTPGLTGAPRLPAAAAASAGQPPACLNGRTGTPSGCAAAVASCGLTPDQLHAAYGVDRLHAAGYQGQGMSLVLIDQSGLDQPGQDLFAACFGLPPVVPVLHFLNGVIPPDGETALDVQVVNTVAPRIGRLDVVVQEADKTAAFLDLFSAALDRQLTGGKLTDAISSSLVLCEQIWAPETVSVMEYILAVAAGSGVSVFAASGDTGSSSCIRADGGGEAAVMYPSSSRFVTAVGGTHVVLDAANRLLAETAWNDSRNPPVTFTCNGGGGERSTLFPRPDYQRGRGIPPTETRRIVPDVSFYSDFHPGYAFLCPKAICLSNQWFPSGGTSAATPYLASALLLVGQARRAHGQPKIGQVNPLLYALAGLDLPGLFRDVTVGDNDVFGIGCCAAGVGFDAASGWGSFDLYRLAQLLTPAEAEPKGGSREDDGRGGAAEQPQPVEPEPPATAANSASKDASSSTVSPSRETSRRQP